VSAADATIADVVSGASRWCIVHGDCLEIMHELSTVDHVIADPPYSRHVHSADRHLRLPDATVRSRKLRTVDLGFTHLDATTRRGLARECARLVRGWAIIFQDFESVNAMRRSLEAAGMRHWRIGAWDKMGTGAPQFNGCGPANWGEAIEIAHSKSKMSWEAGGKRGVWRHITEIHRNGSSSLRVHTTQKPIALMLEIVSDFTLEDELVLDPFAGSGTTGVACVRLGRRFIGIEKNEKYAKIARDRIAAEAANSTLQAAYAGQMALLP
jgi:site-specific DNA-methyltransferase (adenine-specific)